MEENKSLENTEVESEKIIQIRTDLKRQLEDMDKYGKDYDDLIEDYIYLVKLKDDLQKDIKEKGIRFKVKTGNGFMQVKPNESVQNILKVNNQMLRIRQDLGLKAPPESEDGDDDGLC